MHALIVPFSVYIPAHCHVFITWYYFLTGDYDSKVLHSIQSVYASHRTTDPGFNSMNAFDAYRLRVQVLTSSTTISEFQSWVTKAIQEKTWLILVYHNVYHPGQHGVSQYDGFMFEMIIARFLTS